MNRIVPMIALALCSLLLFGYILLSYDSLPARLATHFDLKGNPNGWMSRDALVEVDAGTAILLSALIIGLMAGIGGGWLPRQFLNVPNRDYWLAPERREATAPVLMQFALWMACLNILFLTGVHWLVVQANTPASKNHLNLFSLILIAGGFLIGTGIWCHLLMRWFKRKP